MQVKIFDNINISTAKFEQAMNDWFKANPDITLHSQLQTQSENKVYITFTYS